MAFDNAQTLFDVVRTEDATNIDVVAMLNDFAREEAIQPPIREMLIGCEALDVSASQLYR